MNEYEMDQIASKVVEKLLESERLHALAQAIAVELRELSMESASDLERLGQRLDERTF
jgi:hypothetical protein